MASNGVKKQRNARVINTVKLLEEKLTNLGIEVPKTLTMDKAMELIKEKLDK